MGAEFLHKKTGAIRKCREKQKVRLSHELTPSIQTESIVSVSLLTESAISDSEQFEICIDGGVIKVFKERNLIGFIQNLGSNLRGQIEKAGGRAIGKFDRHLKFSKQLNLSVVISHCGTSHE